MTIALTGTFDTSIALTGSVGVFVPYVSTAGEPIGLLLALTKAA